MYAINYVRQGGFGYALSGEEECGADEHWDPNTSSCFTCDPGWDYDSAQNTCIQSSPPPGGGPSPAPSPGGGGGRTYPGSSPGGTTKASMMTGALPWVIGGAALLGLIYFAGKKKHH